MKISPLALQHFDEYFSQFCDILETQPNQLTETKIGKAEDNLHNCYLQSYKRTLPLWSSLSSVFVEIVIEEVIIMVILKPYVLAILHFIVIFIVPTSYIVQTGEVLQYREQMFTISV